MQHLRSLITCPGSLIDPFIDTLRRSTRPSALRQLVTRHDDDDADGEPPLQPSLPLDGPDQDTDAEPIPPPTFLPDQALAAVLLARALDDRREALAAIADGGAVVIEVPDAELVAPLAGMFRRCVLGPDWDIKDSNALHPSNARDVAPARTLVLFERDGTQKGHNATTGNAEVGIALQMRCPIVGIGADVDRVLPRDLIRVADHRVTVPPMDAEAIMAVIQAVTGKAPQPIDPDLARRATPADLMLAVRSDRGPEGCVKRLSRVVGRTKADDDDATPTLHDLHGLGEAREFGLRLVDDLHDYKAGLIPWAAVAKSVLIWGPPGTGKTMFARALAKTANVNFTATSYSEWQSSKDGHLGHVTRAIRDCFAAAKRNAPSILFIDEIDTLPRRGSGRYADDWWTAIVNTILEQLDGYERREGVVVVAACNSNPQGLDPALVRSGRLDKTVHIPLPDTIALAGIFRTHLGQNLSGLDLKTAAVAAYGGTGADVERWVRDARRRARIAGRTVTLADLMQEIREGRPELPDTVRHRVAYHEAGHAICAMALGVGEPRSLAMHAGGGTAQVDQGAVRAQTGADLKHILSYTLAGRAAEQLVCGDCCAGAGGGDNSDLAIATGIAVRMEATFGLGAQGPLYFGTDEEAALLRLPEIRAAVRHTLEQAEIEARQLLETHRASLDRLAMALLRTDYLDRDEIRDAVDPALYAKAAGKPPIAHDAAGPATTGNATEMAGKDPLPSPARPSA
jgi:ATP-dependent Zn protease